MAWLDIVKNSITSRDVLDRYIGQNNLHYHTRDKYMCPFHGDKNPSISINEKTGKWKCFGCGVGGDGLDFVMLYFKLNQYDALKLLDSDFRLGLENCKKDSNEKIKKIKLEKEKREKQLAIDKSIKKFLSMKIHNAMQIAQEIYNKNCPRQNESIEDFAMDEKRVEQSMWASYQMEYLIWLRVVLDESYYINDQDYPPFEFDLLVVGKFPFEYERGIYEEKELAKHLKQRYIAVSNMLRENSIGYFADRYY